MSLAHVDPARRIEIARAAGKASHRKYTEEQLQAMRRNGGIAVSRNRNHMAKIGRKGGKVISSNRTWMQKIGRKSHNS